MKIQLKQLATIQMGYSFRSRLETSSGGNVAVIQMKDLLQDNTVSCKGLVKVEMESIKDSHFVLKGDLIFRSRGQIMTSAILVEDSGKAIVAAPLLRIRIINHNRVLPEYLNWFISRPEAQSFLTSRAKGTVQKMISKQALEDLEVLLPDIEKQKLIVECADLSACESFILNELAEKREQYVSRLLMHYAQGDITDGN